MTSSSRRTPALNDRRAALLMRMQTHKLDLMRNAWVAHKHAGSRYWVIRWRVRGDNGRIVQRSIYVGTGERLVAAVKRLIRKWRRLAGTVPTMRVQLGLSLVKRMADQLDLHPRGRRRLSRIRRLAKASGNEGLLFQVLSDSEGVWAEHLLWGNSWAARLRKKGLV